MIAATLGEGARGPDGKSPGTRPKMVALLRAELIKAQEYLKKKETAEKGKEPEPSLRSEALVPVLKGARPLLVTVQRASDILTALRQVAGLTPPVPPLVTRLAQGPLDPESGTVADPLAADRASVGAVAAEAPPQR